MRAVMVLLALARARGASDDATCSGRWSAARDDARARADAALRPVDARLLSGEQIARSAQAPYRCTVEKDEREREIRD